MYKKRVSGLADSDLRRIIGYIKHSLFAPGAASSFMGAVQECYGRLEKKPYIYALCNDERLAREGYRKAPVKNYVLIYKIDEEAKAVDIYRFFFGAEDYPNKI
ncbi:MAG: type II toxin-antitoxin system RelE/ParE family toxin [Eubacteriaceae bacterium]|nr:type II toxin-antitoxin system RelE/ParE family toxin [Eubacteriaceae bacterium]